MKFGCHCVLKKNYSILIPYVLECFTLFYANVLCAAISVTLRVCITQKKRKVKDTANDITIIIFIWV